MINLTINNLSVQAEEGETILVAARRAGIKIPTLCYLKEINEIGACRMCVVEVAGQRNLVASCVFPVSDGMAVQTNTPKLRRSRRTTLELIQSNHRADCLSCKRSMDCELQALCHEYDVDVYRFRGTEDLQPKLDESLPHLVKDASKCILCRRCEAVCGKVQIVGVLGVNGRGFSSRVGGGFDLPLGESQCVYCGQCAAACPVGALTTKDDTGRVWDALADPAKRVIVAPAPSVRAQLGECFGMPVGTNVEGKLVTALRRLGFDDVFDIDTFADLTIVEEANEFLTRFTTGGVLPMTTSCSPAWVRFLEVYYPDLLPNVSTCKSPQGMYGAVMKTYYAKKLGVRAEDLYVVSVMPCLAKKYEITRPGYDAAGVPDVDASVSTVGLAQMIKRAGIDFANLPESEFDPAFGIASGAGHIFGASGGVMEAALRTAAEKVTGKPLERLDFKQLRGMEGIKEAEIDLGSVKLKVCAASGLANAAKIMDKVRAGTAEWSFIEIMSCPGGCVNGGGQPHLSIDDRNFSDYRQRRADALYSEDARMTLRKSHENPDILALYRDFLGEPGGETAHHVLHTYYEDRSGTYKWIKA